MVGRTFDVLNLTAVQGCIMPVAFTVVSVDLDRGVASVHFSNRTRQTGIPFDALIAGVSTGDLSESLSGPFEWGRSNG